MMSEGDMSELSFVSAIGSDAQKFFAVTWERVQMESKKDNNICLLSKYITSGFPTSKQDIPKAIQCFWDVKTNLYVHEGVVLYKDRIVIPASLQSNIIENLHSAHQGVTSMFSRAQASVFWPGMTSDIENARNSCRTCHRNAPSHAKLTYFLRTLCCFKLCDVK